ncbi:MAG: Spy/CpxP family protein refolding chaperone [Candidatus Binatia bacterium]
METTQRTRISLGGRAAAVAVGVLILTVPMVGSSKENPGKATRGPEVETRIKTLRTELKITPEQESAWNDVAQAMRDNAKSMEDVRTRQATEERTASAPDMITAYGKTMDAHAEAIHKFASTFQPLYDSMSDAQKKTADSVFRARIHEAAKRSKS